MVVAGLAATVAGCRSDQAALADHAVGERVRHVAADVGGVVPRRLELSEFVFSDPARLASTPGPFIGRLVLVADVERGPDGATSGTVHGYAERAREDGPPVQYRIAGRMLRRAAAPATSLAQFDLTALYTGRRVDRAPEPPGAVRYSLPFRLLVDDRTGAAEITRRPAP